MGFGFGVWGFDLKVHGKIYLVELLFGAFVLVLEYEYAEPARQKDRPAVWGQGSWVRG